MAFLDGSFTQRTSILDQLAPVSQTNATVLGAAINMLYFERLLAIVQVGVFGASATVDVQFQSSATSGGTYALVTGKQITQLVAAGGNNRMVKVGLSAEDLQGTQAATAQFVKLQVIVGVAATLLSYVVIGTCGRFKPENKFNELAAVAQTIDDAS